MHGMICKSLETFLIVNHGSSAWSDIREAAEMEEAGFESMRIYPDALCLGVVAAAATWLKRPVSAMLEDVGTWICTYSALEPVRRLIRFSGPTYEDLLWSLEEMRDRARLAVPNLEFPDCRVEGVGPGAFRLTVSWPVPGAAAVMAGMLRAMADDYGVLALIERDGRDQLDGHWHERIMVTLVEADFATPRDFSFGATA